MDSTMKTKTAVPAGAIPTSSFAQSIYWPFFLIAICGTPIARGHSQEQPPANVSAPREPDFNAPWPEAEKRGLWPVKKTGDVKTRPVAVTPPGAGEQPQAGGEATAPALTLAPPKTTKHEISVSGDFMLGEGTVSVPLGYSLRETLGSLADVPVLVAEADRSSIYFGGTISYSYGQAWYVDLTFLHGNSSGRQNLDAGWLGTIPSKFEITDDWLQAYVRYTFPRLRGKRFTAYLRAGASVVLADLEADAVSPAAGRYTQTDETRDILGNTGFGLGYSLYSSRRLRLIAQLEGEGFFGFRTQESQETLAANEGLSFKTATIDNTVYGSIGRLTLRYEHRLGSAGLFKLFADGGVQVRYTLISYPDATAPDELLWGPYVKLGLRYAF
jgi:hypothetical protein